MDLKLLGIAGFLMLGVSGCSNVEPCNSRPGLSTNCNQTSETEQPDELIVETGTEVFGRNRTNITSFAYDPDTNTVQVELAGFDGFGEYVRRPDIDKDGYLAFESDRGQRGYLALFKQSPSGGLEVASVADADYFGVADYIAIFRRTDGEAPTAGFTNYTGRYNGGIQTSAGGDITLVEGDILVELDFEDGYVEGDIFNRRTYATVVTDPITLDLVHTPIAGENLPNYGFRRTDLNANGVYENGDVFDSATGTNYGDYSGVIGGTDDPNTAADESGFETAGIVEINRGGTTEIGTFIATCTALPDGDGTVCP